GARKLEACAAGSEGRRQLRLRNAIERACRYPVAQIIGQRVTAGIEVVETRRGDLDRVARRLVAVIEPNAATDHEVIRAARPPRESEAGRNVVLVPVPQVLPVTVAVRKRERADRALGNAVLPRERAGAVQTEAVHAAGFLVYGALDLVAQADVERQIRRDPP